MTHPRAFRLASDEALRVMAAMLHALECIGAFPPHVGYLLLPLLDKPRGGRRPILLCTGVVRFWQRLHGPCTDDFM